MKRSICLLLSLILCLSLLPIISLAASGPSVNDIEAVGDYSNIEKPGDSDYLSEYKTLYVNAPKGLAIYTFWDSALKNKRPHYAYHNDPVVVIADKGNAYCILFLNDKGATRAGWVSPDMLTNEPSGDSQNPSARTPSLSISIGNYTSDEPAAVVQSSPALESADASEETVNEPVVPVFAPANGTSSSSVPSDADIQAAGDIDNIEHPEAADYLAAYQTMYVYASKGHEIYTFWDSSLTNKRPHYAYHNDPVILLAQKGNAYCILFLNNKGVIKAGWVSADVLTSAVPTAGSQNPIAIGGCLTISTADYLAGASVSAGDSSLNFTDAKPGVGDIAACGDVGNIREPLADSYLSFYKTMFVKSSKGYEIYVYVDPVMTQKRFFCAAEGDPITVIAIQDNAYCVLYTRDNGETNAGWVSANMLVDVYY